MPVISAALLVHRQGFQGPEVLLVHPGGPYWRGREAAGWSIPKGLPLPGETLEAAAMREFQEEVGIKPPRLAHELWPVRASGKTIHCWMAEGDLDLAGFRSETFQMEWPPRSGRLIEIPEADAAAYFGETEALHRIHKSQRALLEQAFAFLGAQVRRRP